MTARSHLLLTLFKLFNISLNARDQVEYCHVNCQQSSLLVNFSKHLTFTEKNWQSYLDPLALGCVCVFTPHIWRHPLAPL